jgi:hypothetical protein
MKIIPLTQGQFAIVDDEDFEKLNQWKWYAAYFKNNKSFYAGHVMRNSDTNKFHRVMMHRIIMQAQTGQIVDHINHNTLDNRHCNLRIVSHLQNCLNRKKQEGKECAYKGVYCVKNKKKANRYRAWFRHKHLGYFSCPEDAALAYNKAAIAFDQDHSFVNPLIEGKNNAKSNI